MKNKIAKLEKRLEKAWAKGDRSLKTVTILKRWERILEEMRIQAR